MNHFPPIDVCAEAILAGCGFVARSFAGDAKQVRELIKAAFHFHGAAVIDIISPCVTFNNHDRSTKSYTYGKTHESPLHDISFVPHYEEIAVDYEPGEVRDVQLHDGPVIRLRKLNRDYDPTDRSAALLLLEQARSTNEFVTGLIYLNEHRPTLAETLGIGNTPIAALSENRLRPSREAFAAVMAELLGER